MRHARPQTMLDIRERVLSGADLRGGLVVEGRIADVNAAKVQRFP